MSIRVRCPKCGKALTASDSHRGLAAKCPQCGEVLRIVAEDHEVGSVHDHEGAGAQAETGSLLEKYDRIPEWIRWVICWPLSLLGGVLAWLVIYSAGDVDEMPDVIPRLAHPVLVQVVFLALLYFTVPRAKIVLVVVFMLLRTLPGLLLLVGMWLSALGVLSAEEMQIDRDWWLSLVGELLTFAASVVLLVFLVQRRPRDIDEIP